MALPETQREAILFERSEKRLELQRRWRILKEEKRRRREERRSNHLQSSLGCEFSNPFTSFV
jgi:hypothetical protein